MTFTNLFQASAGLFHVPATFPTPAHSPPLPTSAHLFQTSANLCILYFSHSYPLLPTPTHSYPLLPTPTHTCPPLLTYAHLCHISYTFPNPAHLP